MHHQVKASPSQPLHPKLQYQVDELNLCLCPFSLSVGIRILIKMPILLSQIPHLYGLGPLLPSNSFSRVGSGSGFPWFRFHGPPLSWQLSIVTRYRIHSGPGCFPLTNSAPVAKISSFSLWCHSCVFIVMSQPPCPLSLSHIPAHSL